MPTPAVTLATAPGARSSVPETRSAGPYPAPDHSPRTAPLAGATVQVCATGIVAFATSTTRFIPTGAKWFSVAPDNDSPWSGHESTHTAGLCALAATLVDVGTNRLPSITRRPGFVTLLVSRRYWEPDGRLIVLSRSVRVSEPAVAHCPSWMPASSCEFSTVTCSEPTRTTAPDDIRAARRRGHRAGGSAATLSR